MQFIMDMIYWAVANSNLEKDFTERIKVWIERKNQ